MLMEYCFFVCFKHTSPGHVGLAAGTARGQTHTKKKKYIYSKQEEKEAERVGGKQRDHAHMSHIPIRIGEKFWGGSQKALTLER